MISSQLPEQQRRSILATDLDGTLIPLNNDARNISDLKKISVRLQQHAVSLVFVTGRHLESVLLAIEGFELPDPDWIICDVGSSIYRHAGDRQFELEAAYAQHLQQRISCSSLDELAAHLQPIAGLRIQEPEKQNRFKLSFYTAANLLTVVEQQLQQHLLQMNIRCQIIASVDPFNGDGLIDILPPDVSKAFALDWWLQHQNLSREQVIFAGDSGNDLAALTAGFATIVVGNATPELVRQVRATHVENDWSDRLFVASLPATSGVLEGCARFGLFPGGE